jgi:hypothetical protein
MKSISGITDPEVLISVHWQGVAVLLQAGRLTATESRDIPG